MIHCFDTEVAMEYGLYPAIILQNIAHWVTHNEANETNYHDGEYWTYNSVRAFADLFPYMSPKQIRAALDVLKDQGLIKTANFNEVAYDRTLWYTMTEKGRTICRTWQNHLPITAKPFAPQGKSNCPTGQTNTIYKPDINTDNKHNISSKHDSEIAEIVAYLNEKTGSKYRATTASTKRHLNARLEDGFTVADCKAVIDNKYADWKGTQWEKFLRPETLFGGKFESYLNQKKGGSQYAGIDAADCY